MKIKAGDTVTAISGKDRGRSGKVLRVFPKKNTLVVEGLNKYKRHVKKQSQDQPGGVVDIEKPIHASNVTIKKAARAKK